MRFAQHTQCSQKLLPCRMFCASHQAITDASRDDFPEPTSGREFAFFYLKV
ncbi:hypothetical protein HanIR_Chr01g0035041 [Helianthus annuus]|nr:hypothetical protein HanIR_Chr01g0035041 [Helianthus annuus]